VSVSPFCLRVAAVRSLAHPPFLPVSFSRSLARSLSVALARSLSVALALALALSCLLALFRPVSLFLSFLRSLSRSLSICLRELQCVVSRRGVLNRPTSAIPLECSLYALMPGVCLERS